MAKLTLYGYFRSSAAFRLRIALGLKGLDYDSVYIHLAKGEQFEGDYGSLNPQHQLPTLIDGNDVLVQSPAILEYLEEIHPEPSLLPGDPIARARIRAIAMAIGCDMHPINNLRILKYLTGELGHSEAERDLWYRHWVALGFQGVERLMADNPATGRFCHGDTPGLADIYLVPQVFNAKRFKAPLDDYPTLTRVFDACMAHPAFDAAQPSKQPDAE